MSEADDRLERLELKIMDLELSLEQLSSVAIDQSARIDELQTSLQRLERRLQQMADEDE